MADSTHSDEGDNLGLPNNPTPISSRAATPGTDGRRTPTGFKAWAKKEYDKGKAKVERGLEKGEKGVKKLFARGKPKSAGETEIGPPDAGGSGASGMGDNDDITGGLDGDGEAAGGTGAVDELTAGAHIPKTPNAEQVLSVSAELEAGQEEASSSSQLHAPSATGAKDEQTASPEAILASLAPKQENQAVTTHGIKDALTLFGEGSRARSGAIPLGNPLGTAEFTEIDPDTTGGAPRADGAETIPLSMPAGDLSSLQPQATPASVAADNRPLPEEAPVLPVEEVNDALSVPETLEGQTASASEMAHSGMNKSESETDGTKSSKVWAVAKGTLKTALGIAVTLTPEPFKGAANALLKVVDVVEVCVHLLYLCVCCSSIT
jgi:hypothetical protein